jgi:hypothetical protein
VTPQRQREQIGLLLALFVIIAAYAAAMALIK